jgi:hypothetical protein
MSFTRDDNGVDFMITIMARKLDIFSSGFG